MMALTKVQTAILLSKSIFQPLVFQCSNLYTTSKNFVNKPFDQTGKRSWLKYNEKVYEPQNLEEEPRPAFVCHQRLNIKYSPLKMWYIACLIRGMSVDEGIKQLKFVQKKGAKDIREVLIEAKEIATNEHNVEFSSNMWIAESFCGKGKVIKGMRRHARGRFGIVEYKYCHYFVRLEEGKPPKHYYLPYPKEPHEQLEEWLANMRKRKITNSL